jgi:uncharacterized protein with PQ loop repeat
MALTLTDVALVVFTVCNTARVFAYLPQMVKISRDRQGASAISYTTWVLFGVSHLSTTAYAVLVLNDWRMAAVFAANALCCIIIVGLTVWRRAAFQLAQNGSDETAPSLQRRNFTIPPMNATSQRRS